ncbi:hypothetical protein QBC34DRAFT_112118 [Podospora aff. communis PSN243]|uniref:Uncharacterized protein n=1 Tax=Podospora aff. communis PSN243 TaxID=3040156 RepID=A0AAV9GL02_9PEZI|nr:hypothetical protein QBC34DRAFT_112118 [Podospora aff. communis PSN243]
MSQAPPPPPPHGDNPRTTAGGAGLPPGKYDIFIIPEHSAGSGFLYLPSLKPRWNSFLAGVACTLLTVVIGQTLAPAFQAWWASFNGLGTTTAIVVAFCVGIGGWLLGSSQKASGPSSASGGGRYQSGSGYGSGGAGGYYNNAPPSGGPRPSQAPPPNQPPPPPPPQPETPRTEKPHQSWQDQPHQQQEQPRPQPQQQPPPPPTPEPEREQPKPQPKPQPRPAPQATPQATPPPRPSPTKAETKGAWERAREETRRREEERKAREAEQKIKEARERRRQELREKEAREREQREKDAREKEARERLKKEQEAREKARLEQEVREKVEKEVREKAEREAREKLAKELQEREQREAREREEQQRAARAREAELARMREEERQRVEAEKRERLQKEARERLQREAREREAKEAQERKERLERLERERLERERLKKEEEEKNARKGSSYAFSSMGEKTNMWPNGKPPAPSHAASSPGAPKHSPSPTKPTAASARAADTEEEAYSFRPYDKPKKPTARKKSVSDFSESSWAPSASTARTTPPPSMRGPYTTDDPNKIVIRSVYVFLTEFSKTPATQLVSNVGPITDGLILRITSAGLFVDDDVRGTAMREWDIKAWTIKQIEVWCPTHALTSASNTPGSVPTNHPFFKNMPTSARRAAERGATKVFVGEEAVAYLAELGRGCQDVCRHGVPASGARTSVSGSNSNKSGEWTSKGLHVLRVTIRDGQGKRYLFVIDDEQAWKISKSLQTLRSGSQVRALGFSGLSGLESQSILETLGFS